MKTKTAVNQAFKVASSGSKTQYTPHSAKHSIAAERDRRHLTALERKAWSENMGHDTEQITDRHYGKLSSKDRRLAMAGIGEGSDEVTVLENLTDEELGAGLREFLLRRAAGANDK